MLDYWCADDQILLFASDTKVVLGLWWTINKLKKEGMSEWTKGFLGHLPASTTHWTNVGLMLVHSLRCWPRITLFQCIVFAGVLGQENLPGGTRFESRSRRIFVIVAVHISVLQTVQRHGVYSAAYDTVHDKEPLKSFEIRVGHSPGFGLPSVAILPWSCRNDVKQYSYRKTSRGSPYEPDDTALQTQDFEHWCAEVDHPSSHLWFNSSTAGAAYIRVFIFY